jgi:formate C-acetyltransferase
MYYVWHASSLGATPDGRKKEEMIPANYSPSLFMKQKGPISVIKSFTKPDLLNVINGGPLTLEFDQNVFRDDESIEKLGALVKTFITLGGHQLQLNTVSLEKLLDAKKHPDRYKQLIVRVWGWSGYFVELDECYQDHIINRIEFGL